MSFRSTIKKVGRKLAPIQQKINRVVVPVVAAAGSYFGGPVVGEAVAAIGSEGGYYFGSTAARAKGLHGRDARAKGRAERKRDFMYAQIGVGTGAIASGITTAALGGTFTQSVGAAGLGQGGQQIVGLGSPGLFSATPTSDVSGFVTAGNLASQTSSKVPGLVTQSDLAAQLGGTAASTTGTTAASVGTTALGLANQLLASKGGTGVNKNPGMGFPGVGGGGSSGGGDGGGSLPSFLNGPGAKGDGESSALPLVILGALFLLS